MWKITDLKIRRYGSDDVPYSNIDLHFASNATLVPGC